MISLSLICACAGLIWSSGTASADTGHRSGVSLVTGIRSLGRSLGNTGKDVLGTHRPTSPPAAPDAHRQPVVKPVARGAPARAAEALTSPAAPKPKPLIKHPLIKHPLIKHPAVEQPLVSADQHHAKIPSHTGGARTLIHKVTDTVTHTVHSTAGSVHGISSRVGSTADPVERAGHRLREDRRSDDLAASVGGTVHSVSGVVHAADEVVGCTGAAVGRTGGTIGSPVGDTVTGVGNLAGVTTGETTLLRPVASVVQPYGQRDTGSRRVAADPLRGTSAQPASASARQPAVDTSHNRISASTLLSSAPLITLLTAAPADATPAGHVSSAHRSTPPAAMSGTLLVGLAGGPGPGPGQPPQPAGEMITAPASGATWHEHAVLRAAINATTAEPADIHGSSSARPQLTPYDPGYSPD